MFALGYGRMPLKRCTRMQLHPNPFVDEVLH